MDVGTEHILNVLHLRPVTDVAEEWLRAVARTEDIERERGRLASREDALQALAMEHFDKRYPAAEQGPRAEDMAKVHELLAESLLEATKGSGDANAILDCMAGWYITADRRYREAVARSVHPGP